MDEKLKTSTPPALIKIIEFSKKVAPKKSRTLAGLPNSNACINLLVADVPDNLPVQFFSNPFSVVPEWNNTRADAFIEPLFAFAQEYVGDDGGVLLFIPDCPIIRRDVLSWAKAYGYTPYKDWWVINELRPSSFRDLKRTTRHIWILLFVCETHRAMLVKSSFQLRSNPQIRNAAIDLEEDDLVHNFTTAATFQLMNGSIPWRGAREKDPKLLQVLFQASTSPAGVVLDYNASTGASVHACKSIGRHISCCRIGFKNLQKCFATFARSH